MSLIIEERIYLAVSSPPFVFSITLQYKTKEKYFGCVRRHLNKETFSRLLLNIALLPLLLFWIPGSTRKVLKHV
jgi:hypothetical protein